MAIYRGPGGAGDATADATNAAAVAESFADAAGVSAAAAATSANAASLAETAAEAAQAAAEAAQTAAETAETNAETAETNAETAQTAAEAAQTAAEAAQAAALSHAGNAESFADAAEISAGNAETSYQNTLLIFGNAEDVAAAVLAAETSAGNAETFSLAASGYADTALSHAGNAEDFATAASGSASAAATSASNASNSFDSFDDRYLGSKTSDPSVDNDGNALLTGALYWNSVGNVMKVYTGTVWITFNSVNNPVDQSDIGTAPNEIPLNQYLGNLAYQDASAIAGPVVVGGSVTSDGNVLAGIAVGNTGSAYTFNLEVANFFSATLNQNSTFTFSNPPVSGNFGGFILELTNGGAFAITWPASIDWPGGTAPTLTASGVDQLVFTTRDGGTTYLGFVAGLDIK